MQGWIQSQILRYMRLVFDTLYYTMILYTIQYNDTIDKYIQN